MRAFKPIWRRSQADAEPRATIHEHSAQVLRFLRRLPRNARNLFTERQLDLMDVALSDGDAPQSYAGPPKRLRWRLRFPFLGYVYSASLVVGRERRPSSEHRQQWQKQAILTVIAITGAALITGTLLLGGYALKSALGIDVFPGPSVLHGTMF